MGWWGRTLILLLLLGQLTVCVHSKLRRNPLCPKHCVCRSKEAFCNAAGFTRLPRFLPQNAETIRLQENSIRRLKYRGLKGLRFLKHLLMKGNDISYIEPSAFRDMTNLIALSLTDNNLRKLHYKTFKGLSKLKVLSLRDNRISAIEKLFNHMTALQLLNLGSNKVRAITDQTFAYNWQLQVLDLHDNNIRTIHQYAFHSLLFLRYLVLRDNPIKSLDLNFRKNLHLDLLDLTNCQLTTLVRGLPHSISDLRLSENNIQAIDSSDFKGTRNIRLLVLNNNKIQTISPKALSRLLRLYDVYIGKNQLRSLPTHLPASLHGLFANYNNISTLPETVFHPKNKLQKLYLNNNHITSVDPSALRSLSQLRSLDLSHNKLQEIHSRTFESNGWLEILDLSNNPIQTLQDQCFNGLQNLHILQLSSVTLAEHIKPAVFQHMQKLLFLDLSNSSRLVKHMAQNPYVLDYLYTVQDLNLMNDQLQYLPSNFPTYFPFLKMIKLVGNPWHCNSDIYWLTVWMRNNSVQFFAPQFMTCASPQQLVGRNLLSISENELTEDWGVWPQTLTHTHTKVVDTTLVGAGLRVTYVDKKGVKGKTSGQLAPRESHVDKPPPDLSRHKLEPSWWHKPKPKHSAHKVSKPSHKRHHHNLVAHDSIHRRPWTYWVQTTYKTTQHRPRLGKDTVPLEPMEVNGHPLYDDSSGLVSGDDDTVIN